MATGVFTTKIETVEYIEYIDSCWHAHFGTFRSALLIEACRAIETFCLDRKPNILSAYPVASEVDFGPPHWRCRGAVDEDIPLRLLRGVAHVLKAEIIRGGYGWQRDEAFLVALLDFARTNAS